MLDVLAVLLSTVAFIALAIAFVTVARRASKVIAETRDDERFRRAVEDLAGRIDLSLGAVISLTDDVRRHRITADSIGPNVDAARDAVRRYSEEAQLLDPPVPAEDVRADLLAELERADRALEMVAHGCSLLEDMPGGPRELEAQTAIKRGYLNALHAREAIARHAADLAASRSAEQRRWLTRRSA